MKDSHAEEVVLEAEVTNTGALSLYRALGFVRDKRLHRWAAPGRGAVAGEGACSRAAHCWALLGTQGRGQGAHNAQPRMAALHAVAGSSLQCLTCVLQGGGGGVRASNGSRSHS